jgi:hypothetical protein
MSHRKEVRQQRLVFSGQKARIQASDRFVMKKAKSGDDKLGHTFSPDDVGIPKSKS